MTYTQVWDAMNNKPHDSIIVRDEDGAFIPFDEANRDYQDYLAWLDEGNAPTPYTPPAPQGEETNGDPPEPAPEPARKATVVKSGSGPAPSRVKT
jgi:hypothetical protein